MLSGLEYDSVCQSNLITGFTDTHCFDQPINAGIYVPNSVDNMEQFVDYIFTGKQELICDYDLYHKAYMDYKNKQ